MNEMPRTILRLCRKNVASPRRVWPPFPTFPRMELRPWVRDLIRIANSRSFSMADQRNEGEGNRTAAKIYNTAQQAFIRQGKVPPAAETAKQALHSEEKAEMEKAEKIGRK